MQHQQLYINDILCDLSDDKPIAITFQVNDLAILSDRQSTFSQSVRLPKTVTNRKALGYSDVDAFTQMEPYKYNTAKYIINGIEIITHGRAVILNSSDDFEVVLTYGLSGFGDLIDGKKLSDLDFSGYIQYNTTPAQMASSQVATDGYYWPVVDFGQLDVSGRIDTRYLRRAFFVHSIMEQVAFLTGYKIYGSILSTPEYLREVIQNPSANQNADTLEENMPDITIKDWLKDFMQRYFLTPEVDNYKKTLTFRSLDELYLNKGVAKDWTDKFIDDNRTDEFKISNYAQENILKYKDAEINIDPNGIINIVNEVLPASDTLVTGVFSGIGGKDDIFATNHVSYVELKTDEAGVLGSGEPLVMYNRVIGGGPMLFLFIQPPEPAPFVYSAQAAVPFFKLNSAKGLVYQELINRYGTGLQRLLTKARVITRYAILNESDVQDFDFFVPVYDKRESKYYYVNKIDNFIAGVKTKVQLIRM